MKTIREYKQMALQELKGNWTNPVLATLIVSLVSVSVNIDAKTEITSTLAILTLAALAISIFLDMPMRYRYDQMFLSFMRKEGSVTIQGLFSYFKKDFNRAVCVPLLTSIFTFLWALLLIIPGIIKGLGYSMANMVAMDHPELDSYDCLMHSQELMRGHKMDLFLLNLSFIGWILLSILSLGIGLLWIVPWMQSTIAAFYHDLLREAGELVEE